MRNISSAARKEERLQIGIRLGPVSFTLPRLDRVISGAGAVSQLTAELDRLGATRVVVVTGRTLGASAPAASLKRDIGDRCVCVFTGARQHVPSDTVARSCASSTNRRPMRSSASAAAVRSTRPRPL